jgi:acetylornithine/N-succinyldiaminopimelate aminotransferase
MSDLRARFEAAMMPNYGVPPVALVRGEGCRVWDTDGNAYLDLIGGIAVSALGHAHPALVAAVSAQVATLAHTSNLFLHEPEVVLAERLLHLLGGDGRVFFTNSGTEANEAAYKLVRRHGGAGRTYVVAAEGSFHGRTMGALALTGKASIREPFAPFGADVRFVPYGSEEALRAAVTEECAAVFLEPTQGEGGVVPAPEGYLTAARRICDETGAALVLDEIQSGIGRTGVWFQHQREGVRPDVITLAKGLGGGLPIGACVGLGAYATAFGKGDHGSTFGGNPVVCAAALAVVATVDDALLEQVRANGTRLLNGLSALPGVVEARGAGLLVGAELDRPAQPIVDAALDAGLVCLTSGANVLRLAPPLVVETAEIDRALQTLTEVMNG